MGATKFRNRLKEVCPQIHVSNTSVDNIPSDCDVAVVQTTLAELGYVDETYVDAMQEREKLVTTYMGMGVAIRMVPVRLRKRLRRQVSYSCSILKVCGFR